MTGRLQRAWEQRIAERLWDALSSSAAGGLLSWKRYGYRPTPSQLRQLRGLGILGGDDHALELTPIGTKVLAYGRRICR